MLHTGETIEVPFELLLVFATNLRPRDLVDEAFLRRVRYKILIANPSEEQFREIFRRAAAKSTITIEEGVVDYFIQRYYKEPGREMRANHPWDLVAYAEDFARFEGHAPQLSQDVLDLAAAALFVAD